jgi:Caulimovirus viroplasmin/GRF zinc finger
LAISSEKKKLSWQHHSFGSCRYSKEVSMPPKGPAYYAVQVGRTPGVYTTWSEAELQVRGYPGAVHKKFPTRIEAETFVKSSSKYGCSSSVGSQDAGRIERTAGIFSVPGAGYGNTSTQSSATADDIPRPPKCLCGIETVKLVVSKDNHNKGREFYNCKTRACNFFKWASEPLSDLGDTNTGCKTDGPQYDVIIYSDGGCKGNQDVANNNHPAGW